MPSIFAPINIFKRVDDLAPLHPYIQKEFDTKYQFNPAHRAESVCCFFPGDVQYPTNLFRKDLLMKNWKMFSAQKNTKKL